MTITNSLELYNSACREAGIYGEPGTGLADTYVLYGTNSSYVDRRAAYLEPYYIRIIEAMFFELVTGGRSPLLSLLCSRNGIEIKLENVKIDFLVTQQGMADAYDLKPLLDGLNVAFSGDLSRCSTLYFGTYSKYVFQGVVFDRSFDHVAWIKKALTELDQHIGRIHSRQLKNDSEGDRLDPQESGSTAERENKEDKDKENDQLTDSQMIEVNDTYEDGNPGLTTSIPRERLEEIAAGRRKADEETAERLATLQKAIQEELGQIREIREGVEYNYVLETVLQLIELFIQMDDVLHYHPDTSNPESYTNLIETCYELRSNILQALAFLDVTPILRADVPYDPQFYQVTPGLQPARKSRVMKVLRPGFVFKGKVLQKALVSIS